MTDITDLAEYRIKRWKKYDAFPYKWFDPTMDLEEHKQWLDNKATIIRLQRHNNRVYKEWCRKHQNKGS